jgi:enoyl-CoA hydratase
MSTTDPTGTSNLTAAGTGPGVRFGRDRAAATLTLDRAAKLNAIDSAMKTAIANEIPRIARDPQVYAVLLRAAPGRMFSAGGDIREFYDLARGDPGRAAEECAREYRLIWLLDCFSKPSIALIDGPVMGTGVGIVHTSTHRVAGAGYRFQMPETLIGFFPDNGVCWHLARLPHEIGTWLGLTGTAIGREDAYWLDLVTHCIEGGRFDEIASAIANAEPIDPVLGALHEPPGAAPLQVLAPLIEHCFSADSTAGIIERLEGSRTEREWCAATITTLRLRSPMALEVTLRHLRRARHLDLRQTLMVDYRLAVKLVTSHDFLEGVRARIVEKSGEPRWQPSTLNDVGERLVDQYFDQLPSGELNLPTRQEMLGMRV